MAGEVIQGRFGNVQAIDTKADPASAAGNPATPGDIQQQLSLIAHNAQVAATRLVQLVPAGAVPKATLDQFFSTYSTIQSNVADIAQRADSGAALKDATEVQKQAQQFVDGVEGLIKETAGAAPAVPAAPQRQIPWGLIGIGAVSVGAIGFAIYQVQKSNKAAAAAARKRMKGSR